MWISCQLRAEIWGYNSCRVAKISKQFMKMCLMNPDLFCNIGLVGSEVKLRKHGLSCLVSVVCAALWWHKAHNHLKQFFLNMMFPGIQIASSDLSPIKHLWEWWTRKFACAADRFAATVWSCNQYQYLLNLCDDDLRHLWTWGPTWYRQGPKYTLDKEAHICQTTFSNMS